MPQVVILQDGAEPAVSVELPLPGTASVSIWRDPGHQCNIEPSADPGLWKASVVDRVTIDLPGQRTTVRLTDRSEQQFDTPARIQRRLRQGGGAGGMGRVLLDYWASHLVSQLALPQNLALWQLSSQLAAAREEQAGASEELQRASEQVAQIKESAQAMRRGIVRELDSDSDLSRIPAGALECLAAGLDSDVERARGRLMEQQSKVELRKARRASAEGESLGNEAAGSAGEGPSEEPEEPEDPMSPVGAARQERDHWHVELQHLLEAKASFEARFKTLAGSMRSRARQKLTNLFQGAPSMICRMSLSHQSLWDALQLAVNSRQQACEQLDDALRRLGEAELQMECTQKTIDAEVAKMQQNGFARDSLTRQDSFSLPQPEA